jgi:signal transduction histidine kinase
MTERRPQRHAEPFDLARGLVVLITTLVVPSLTLAIFGLAVLMSENVPVAPYVLMMILLFGAMVSGTILVARALWRGSRLSRLKIDFVGHVSHELRTPLTSLRMFIETLQLGRARTDEERQECLDLLAREAERLSEMIERVLEWSRLEAGRKKVDMRPLDVSDVVEGAGAGELINNAVKYGPSDQTVRIHARRAGRFVDVAVDDEGPGIRRRDRQRIFERVSGPPCCCRARPKAPASG